MHFELLFDSLVWLLQGQHECTHVYKNWLLINRNDVQRKKGNKVCAEKKYKN